ncbi:FAD-dependent oxidoreductase [Phenylobacterium immobile]|uniref:FAD-dependent oxidoreductase n=1 Tax=Phenylobacterium immobile TaxID=21 RepID=UPI000A546D87|nr:FAD-dependent oxidoreductase [Phenylobacterium immobile]
MARYDVFVVGAGTSGMPAAGFAAERGLKVCVVEADNRIGGTLHLSSGQMSAAGTRLQAEKGIEDTPQAHFDDIMRISRGTAEPTVVGLAVSNAADTIHWLLDLGFEMEPGMPVIMYGHEPYSTARTYWGPDGGRTILGVIGPWFQEKVDAGQIDLKLSTKLLGLKQGAGGAILAAVVQGPDGVVEEIEADHFVLASGGYTANGKLFSQLHAGRPLYPLGANYSQGDGVMIGLGAGGYLRGGDMFLPSFGGNKDPNRPGFFGIGGIIMTPQHRMPWEIYVNYRGERYVREDTPSVDERERSLLAAPGLGFYVVFDQAIYDASPAMTMAEDKPTFLKRFDTLEDYLKADTIAELATMMGVDVGTFEATIAAFNDGQAKGEDSFGREHMPLPIAQGPFYAVRNYGTSVKTYAGLGIDDQLRVTDRTGTPIQNLYAAGEVIGGGSLTGNSFCGGMSVTPAMTFGRLLGQSLGTQGLAANYLSDAA